MKGIEVKICPEGFELTEKVSEGLVKVEKPLPNTGYWTTPWYSSLPKSQIFPEEGVSVVNLFNENDADGRYLILRGGYGLNTFLKHISILFLTLAVLIVTFLTMPPGFEMTELMGKLIITGLLIFLAMVFHIAYRKVPARNFFIFDRESGNVLFPKKLFRQRLVVPFSKVEAMIKKVVTRTSGRSHVTYHIYLFSKFNLNSSKRYSAALNIGVEEVSDSFDNPWSYICCYMDKKVSPMTLEPFRKRIEWYRKNKITLPDFYHCSRWWDFNRFPIRSGFGQPREGLPEQEYHDYREQYFKLIDNVRSLTKSYFCQYSGNYFIPWKFKSPLIILRWIMKYIAITVALIATMVLLDSITGSDRGVLAGIAIAIGLWLFSAALYGLAETPLYSDGNNWGVYVLNMNELKEIIIDESKVDLWRKRLKGVDLGLIKALDVNSFLTAKSE